MDRQWKRIGLHGRSSLEIGRRSFRTEANKFINFVVKHKLIIISTSKRAVVKAEAALLGPFRRKWRSVSNRCWYY
jgi:hypothetical protein